MNLDKLAAFVDPTYKVQPDLSRGSDAFIPGVSHYVGLVKAASLPANLSCAPNLRHQNLKSQVAKKMRDSLRSNDGNFHLRNKGITILASAVTTEDNGTMDVLLCGDAGQDGDGILDGGHTYKIIQEAISDGVDISNQYVFVWIRVNVQVSLRASIAEALNDTATVSVASLANRRDEFAWLKNVLPTSSLQLIAWQQNETGCVAKVEELIAQLYAVNANFQQNSVDAYTSRAKTVGAFRRNADVYTSHTAAACDTLKLYEYIQFDLVDKVLPLLGSRAVDSRSNVYPVVFDSSYSGRSSKLARSVAMVLLGAAKSFLEESGGKYMFDRTLDEMKHAYATAWPVLADALREAWNAPGVNGDPGAFGRKRESWDNVFAAMQTANAKTDLPSMSDQRTSRFYEIGMSAEELEEEWREELHQALHDAAQLRGSAEGLSRDETYEIFTQVEYAEVRIGAIRKGIERLSSSDFGYCAICAEPIELGRLYQPQFAVSCVRCSG